MQNIEIRRSRVGLFLFGSNLHAWGHMAPRCFCGQCLCEPDACHLRHPLPFPAHPDPCPFLHWYPPSPHFLALGWAVGASPGLMRSLRP